MILKVQSIANKCSLVWRWSSCIHSPWMFVTCSAILFLCWEQ